jgi:hypothetical protein
MADQPGFDFNQLAQRMGIGTGGGGPAGPEAKPESVFDVLTQSLDKAFALVGKMITTVNLEKVGSTGIFSHIDFQKGAIQANNNILHQGVIPDARGGVLANVIADGTQIASVRDFSKINMPSIEGMAMNTGIDISPANLGTLTPQSFSDATAGMGRSGSDMGIG